MKDSKLKTQNSKLQIKQEHSAGGCVYKRNDRSVQWLLGKHSGYHKWVLPKGLVETDETPLQAVVREVQEEMGIEAKVFAQKPIKAINYVYMAEIKPDSDSAQPIRRVKTYQEDNAFETVQQKVKVSKQVDFYLMEYVSGDPKDHDWEMETAGWFDYEEAREKLAFADEREALRVARDTISSLSVES